MLSFFRKKAEKILDNTEDILKKEETLKKIVNIANRTLEEAEKLEEIKKQIPKLLENEDALRKDLDEALKTFDKDFQKLLNKYDSSKFESLLDELKTTTEELQELTGDEAIDIPQIDYDINMYLECMDCYQEYLEKCGKSFNLTENCLQKIEECKYI